jgi:hypothetical protein
MIRLTLARLLLFFGRWTEHHLPNWAGLRHGLSLLSFMDAQRDSPLASLSLNLARSNKISLPVSFVFFIDAPCPHVGCLSIPQT